MRTRDLTFHLAAAGVIQVSIAAISLGSLVGMYVHILGTTALVKSQSVVVQRLSRLQTRRLAYAPHRRGSPHNHHIRTLLAQYVHLHSHPNWLPMDLLLGFATILRVFGRPQSVVVEQTVLELPESRAHSHPHSHSHSHVREHPYHHHGYMHREIDPPLDSGKGLSVPAPPVPTIKRHLAPVHYAHATDGDKREPLKGRKSYVVMEEWVLDRD